MNEIKEQAVPLTIKEKACLSVEIEKTKFYGMIFMVLDHIAVIAGPGPYLYGIMRMVGRLALPAFALACVHGFEGTRNLNKYILRLLGLAFVSQWGYNAFIDKGSLNDVFSLALGLVTLKMVEKSKVVPWLMIAGANFLGVGPCGSALVLGQRNKDFVSSFLICGVLSCVYYISSGCWWYWGLMLWPFVRIVLRVLPSPWIPRWAFYVFYPVHILLIRLFIL